GTQHGFEYGQRRGRLERAERNRRMMSGQLPFSRQARAARHYDEPWVIGDHPAQILQNRVRWLIHPVPVLQQQHGRTLSRAQREDGGQRLLHGERELLALEMLRDLLAAWKRQQVLVERDELLELGRDRQNARRQLLLLPDGGRRVVRPQAIAKRVDERQIGGSAAVRLA